MILRRRDRGRQMAQSELFQAWQKALLLLAAKHLEYELGGVGRAAPRDHGEDEAGEEGMIEIRDGAPRLPFCLARVVFLCRGHMPDPVRAGATELGSLAPHTLKCLLSFRPWAW
jgi:hypothetical protein